MLTDDERKTLRTAANLIGDGMPARADHRADLAAKLRAIASPRVATVGELLATAPVGITIWTATSGEAMRYMVIDGRGYCQYWSTGRRRWSDAVLSHLDIGRPARWISLGDFDPRDPSTRGPIGEG
mgnify:CR=1 FL=1